MSKAYARVRRSWEFVEPREALRALWVGERFESEDETREALMAYEVAVRVEGWDAVKGWARELIEEGKMLHAHKVELAMRAVEVKDRDFFRYLTHELMKSSPPKMFRFWVTLFRTRHVHFGERLFREQLGALSDYHVVKYRRVLREIFRVLRFRCKTVREVAVGAIVFGEYKKYDMRAYPSEVFETYVACHKVARTRPKTKGGKLVSKARHTEMFSVPAGRLGIWSVVEGIRTSYQLPRTLEYLCVMAPKMTDHELLRSLSMFDDRLKTASHKKASERVLSLAEHLKGRLKTMTVELERWCTIYPHITSPVLVEVLEEVMEASIEGVLKGCGEVGGWCPMVVVESGLDVRRLRRAVVSSCVWLAGGLGERSVSVCGGVGEVRVGCGGDALHPWGYGARWERSGWGVEGRRWGALFGWVRGELGEESRAGGGSEGIGGVVRALRAGLRRGVVLRGGVSDVEVPVCFVDRAWGVEEGRMLRVHADHFRLVVCVVQGGWGEKAKGLGEGHNVVFVEMGATVEETLERVEGAVLERWEESGVGFAQRRARVERAARGLVLGGEDGLVSYMHDWPVQECFTGG